ncbi:MAG: YHS domain-containing protein [Acidobacteriota bacterium]
MFRAIVYLIGFMLVMSVIRAVLSIISKAFTGLSNTSSPQAGAARSRPHPGAPSGGELKKDPVCGTFISTATAFQKFSQGETYYFCSTECRDKFNV